MERADSPPGARRQGRAAHGPRQGRTGGDGTLDQALPRLAAPAETPVYMSPPVLVLGSAETQARLEPLARQAGVVLCHRTSVGPREATELVRAFRLIFL